MKSKFVIYERERYNIYYYRDIYGAPKIVRITRAKDGEVINWREDKNFESYVKDKMKIED